MPIALLKAVVPPLTEASALPPLLPLVWSHARKLRLLAPWKLRFGTKRRRVAAAYAVFAAILLPFLVFVAPRVTASLHPQTVINPQGKILMDAPTKAVFFGAMIGFSWLFLWMLGLETRAARLARRERARGAA